MDHTVGKTNTNRHLSGEVIQVKGLKGFLEEKAANKGVGVIKRDVKTISRDKKEAIKALKKTRKNSQNSQLRNRLLKMYLYQHAYQDLYNDKSLRGI